MTKASLMLGKQWETCIFGKKKASAFALMILFVFDDAFMLSDPHMILMCCSFLMSLLILVFLLLCLQHFSTLSVVAYHYQEKM